MPELLIGVLLIGIVSLVLGRMLLAFVSATNFTLRQTSVLAAANRAMMNFGKRDGLVWATQEASALRSLSPTLLQVTNPAPAAIDYYISTNTLVQRQTGLVSLQASGPTGLAIRYFEIASNGLIFESTAATNASLATFTMSLAGKGAKQRTYVILSAAGLRNK